MADEAGVAPNVRSTLLNHVDTNTVQRYDHVSANRTAAARELVREVIGR
jgi:site-specific recombinase XerD